MKIAFLTGSLEAGRDGVGDYTAALAETLAHQGHEVLVVSLNDRFAKGILSGNASFRWLRLPSALPWSNRIENARRELARFVPEWVSLQFVCYAFHPKGMVHGLAAKLAPLLTDRKLHIMFHEIWLCKESGWGWKHRMVGALQRHFIVRFVSATNPAVMHTSNATYSAVLKRAGISVDELGLFGNVPILSEPGTPWMEAQLRSVLGPAHCRDIFWLFGFFGTLHPQWPPEPLLTHLHHAAQAVGKRPVLLSIGRIGDAGLELWNRLARDYSGRFIFLRLGEQPVERISEYLGLLNCGIATTPLSILGKSGVVASMLEHGLPVIVNRDDAPGAGARDKKLDPLIIRCDEQLESRLRAGLRKGPRTPRRPLMAREFEHSLTRAARSDAHNSSPPILKLDTV